MKWITRKRPKIDRIACPWLIARYMAGGHAGWKAAKGAVKLLE